MIEVRLVVIGILRREGLLSASKASRRRLEKARPSLRSKRHC